jgi:hypothetical protein
MPRIKGVNKSEMVRAKLRRMGLDASPTEISRKLKEEGYEVSPNAVSGIKLAMKTDRGHKGRGRYRSRLGQSQPSIEEVYQVWALANRIGKDRLRQIVRKMP